MATSPLSIVRLILLVFAFVCFVIGAMQNPPTPSWNRIVSAGLAFLTASFIPWPL